MAKLCMGCMNPLPEDGDTCPVCGYSPANRNPDHCLPAGVVLQEHYIVGRQLSESSDSLLYIGYDRQLKEPCFIQEFYPDTLCRRELNSSVVPLTGCERLFGEYADEFRTLMRALARMRELPAIIPVYDIFEENGTLYAVSDYFQGTTLTKKLKSIGGRMPWSEARPLFMSLMGSLTRLHDTGVRHLAICPDNILIGADGKPHLRGFSIPACRQAGRDITPALKAGYAAPEQYTADAELTDATDVYGIAATIFRTVTGNEPPAGNKRAKNSDDLFMSADVAEELTQQVCVALFNALQVQPDSRTEAMAQLRNELSVEPTVSALVDELEEDRQEKPNNRKMRNLILLFGCSLAALLAIVLIALTLLGGSKEPDSSAPTALPTLPTTTTQTNPNEKTYSVDSVVGLNYYDIRDTKLAGDMKVEIAYETFSNKAAGTILSQTPEAGTPASKETTIQVVISNGSKNEKLKVPDVSGWKEKHAKLYLEALGFRVETVKLQASSYEKGLVDSTDPAVGTEKRIGDTITLRVSNVPTTTTTTTTADQTDTSNFNEETGAMG